MGTSPGLYKYSLIILRIDLLQHCGQFSSRVVSAQGPRFDFWIIWDLSMWRRKLHTRGSFSTKLVLVAEKGRDQWFKFF